MPRMAAVVGVLATATLCIGFNVVRYPVVWQMVNGAQPAQAAPGPPAANQAVPAVTASLGTMSSAKPSGASQQPVSATVPRPTIAAETEQYGSALACCGPGGACVLAGARDPGEPPTLVPISPATPEAPDRSTSWGRSSEETSGRLSESADRVRPLPPVNQQFTFHPATPQWPLPEEPIPFYPNTAGP